MNRRVSLFAGVFVGLVLASCRDEPLALEGGNAGAAPQAVQASVLEVAPDGGLSAFPDLVDFVNPVTVGVARRARPYESSDQALVEAVAAEGGKVFIGFRPPEAARTRVTGIVPGIRKADALAWRAEIEEMGATIIQTYRGSATVVAMIEPESAPVLNRLPFVNFVEPVGMSHPLSLRASTPPARTPTAPIVASALRHEFPAQDTSWGVSQVRAPAAWALNKGYSANITILDQGVDSAHALVSGGDAQFNLTGCLHSEPTFTTCWPGTNDVDGHGAFVFGIAAGRDNANGWIGIAPLPASVTSVRVCAPQGCPHNAIIAGLDWVANNGIDREIVNMSFGGEPGDTPIEVFFAIANAYNSGALLMASAGNTANFTSVTYPAQDTRVMAVSGTREGDAFASPELCDPTIGNTRTDGSVSGPEVEISAPFTATSMWSHLRYSFNCGTSASAPVVAGVAALIWTKWPTWTASQVRDRLTSTAIDLGPNGRDAQFGYGRVDAKDALFDFFAGILGPTLIFEPGTYQWSAFTSPTNAGDGSYTYQWAESYNGGSTWVNLSTDQTFSRNVNAADEDWHLRVTIASAGYVRSKVVFVRNQADGCEPPDPCR